MKKKRHDFHAETERHLEGTTAPYKTATVCD